MTFEGWPKGYAHGLGLTFMKVLRFILGVVLGAVVVVAVISYRAAPAAEVETVRPTSTATIDRQIASVEQALAAAARTGTAVPLSVIFTERDLQVAASAYFPQTFGGARLTDPIVRLRRGRINLDMTASLSILRTTATVVAVPTVRAGQPAVRVDSATVGGQPVPESARDAIASQLAQALAAGLPPKLVVSTIDVTEGQLTVFGVANP